MTNVYVCTTDDRYLFKSIVKARQYALMYLAHVPEEEEVDIWPVGSWEEDEGWDVEMYTRQYFNRLPIKTQTKYKAMANKYFRF